MTVEVTTQSEGDGQPTTTVLRGEAAEALADRVHAAMRAVADLPGGVTLSSLRFAIDDPTRSALIDAIASVPLPVPSTEAAVTNATRVHEFRQSLVNRGAFTVQDVAAGTGMKPGTALKWLERHVQAGRLFTVKVDGRVRVPASLLDSAFDPIKAWEPVLAALDEAEPSDWGKWAWIDSPSSLLSGEVPSEVIEVDPDRVLHAAERRVLQTQS